jgi:hypothetical protein
LGDVSIQVFKFKFSERHPASCFTVDHTDIFLHNKFMDFRWNDWNIEHIAEHGVSPEDAERAIRAASHPYPRKIQEDKWLVWGRGRGGPLAPGDFRDGRR